MSHSLTLWLLYLLHQDRSKKTKTSAATTSLARHKNCADSAAHIYSFNWFFCTWSQLTSNLLCLRTAVCFSYTPLGANTCSSGCKYFPTHNLTVGLTTYMYMYPLSGALDHMPENCCVIFPTLLWVQIPTYMYMYPLSWALDHMPENCFPTLLWVQIPTTLLVGLHMYPRGIRSTYYSCNFQIRT